MLERTRATTLAALAHQDMPFERVVELLQPDRSLAYGPVVQVHFGVNRAPAVIDRGGVRWRPELTSNGTAKVDLSLSFDEDPDGYTGRLLYSTDLFDASTARAMVSALRAVLRAAVTAPDRPVGRIALLDPDQRHRVLVGWNDTGRAVPPATLPELFAAQVAAHPTEPALRWAGGELSYAQLNARTDRLARLLTARGAGPERRVGLVLPRGPDLFVALLAVAKTGAAYVPIDLN